MDSALLVIAAVLVLVALGVQVYYLRGITSRGAEAPAAAKWVSYLNIAMLALLALGLLAFGIMRSGALGGR